MCAGAGVPGTFGGVVQAPRVSPCARWALNVAEFTLWVWPLWQIVTLWPYCAAAAFGPANALAERACVDADPNATEADTRIPKSAAAALSFSRERSRRP